MLRWPELQFPYTSTGKLLRRKVGEWVCAHFAIKQDAAVGNGAAASAEPGNKDAILSLIAELTGEPAPSVPDTNALRLSEDLHLDSLGRVQLQSAIEERFAIDIDDDAIATAQSLGDLRMLLGRDVARSPLPAVRSQPQAASQAPRDPALSSAQVTPGDVTHATERGRLETGNEQTTMDNAPPVPPRDEHLYPHWPWSWPIRALRVAFLELAMRPLVWLLAKPRVVYGPGVREALDKLRKSGDEQRTTNNGQPVLLVANHITYYDGALVLYALPAPLRRHVAAAMSGEMLLDYRRMRNQGNFFLNLLAPAAYWLLTALFNVFPLPRDRGFRRSFAHAGEAMDRGYSVLIFPEGTRSLTGHMNPFRSGIGLLALEIQAPIVPIALRGIYSLVAERNPHARTSPRPRWFHAGRIEIRVGMPVPTGNQSIADPAALTASLESALRALLEQPGSGPPLRVARGLRQPKVMSSR